MRFTSPFLYFSTSRIIASESIKSKSCPLCHKKGYIKSHGKLIGVHHSLPTPAFRGLRFFCSNRYSNAGCGRTFSVLFSSMISKSTVRAKHLTELFNNLLCTGNLHKAWSISKIPFSVRSAYRWLKLFEINQPHLRSQLYEQYKNGSPLQLSHLPIIIQSLSILKHIYPKDSNYIEKYQQQFQSPIFYQFSS